MAFAATSQRRSTKTWEKCKKKIPAKGTQITALKLMTLNATFLFCLLLQCQQMPQTGLSDLPVIIKLLLQL